MREKSARVLAAALLTGAIAFATAMPALFGAPREAGQSLTAPPSSLQRSVHAVPFVPSSQLTGAKRLADVRSPVATNLGRLASSRGVGSDQRLRPASAGHSRPGGTRKPAPTPRPTPTPTPTPSPTPTPAPPPATPPDTRELAAAPAAPTPAAPTPHPAPPQQSKGKGHGKEKVKAKRDKDKSGKEKGDCPPAVQTPVAAPPVTPAAPQPSAPAQEQPDADKGHGDERGNGSDKAKAKDKERDNGHDK